MKKCKWQRIDKASMGFPFYETSCEVAHFFEDGGDICESGFKYCPYCGKEIEE